MAAEQELAPGGWIVKVALSSAGGEPIGRWYGVGETAKLDAQLAPRTIKGWKARPSVCGSVSQ